MDKPENLGRLADPHREMALWALPEPLSRAAFAEGLPTGPFICLLVWDSEGESVDSIAAVTDTLLRAGCVYANAWGPGCSRVHDIFDEELVMMCLDGDMPDDDEHLVMTVWHEKESLKDALFYLFCCSTPAEAYEGSCGTSLVVTIDAATSDVSLIRSALGDPATFLDDLFDEERGSEGEPQ